MQERGFLGAGNDPGIWAGGGNQDEVRMLAFSPKVAAQHISEHQRVGVADFLTPQYHELSLQKSVLAVTD